MQCFVYLVDVMNDHPGTIASLLAEIDDSDVRRQLADLQIVANEIAEAIEIVESEARERGIAIAE